MTTTRFDLIAETPCLDFANTIRGRGTKREEDLLGSFADLLDWSRAVGSLPERDLLAFSREARNRADEAERVLHRARRFRDAAYRLFADVSAGCPPARDPLDALNQDVRRCTPYRALEREHNQAVWRWRVGSKLEALLWPIVWSTAELLTSDRREQVRQCAHEECTWLFLDRSKNRSRRWCVPEVCGNRARVRRHYLRRGIPLKRERGP